MKDVHSACRIRKSMLAILEQLRRRAGRIKTPPSITPTQSFACRTARAPAQGFGRHWVVPDSSSDARFNHAFSLGDVGEAVAQRCNSARAPASSPCCRGDTVCAVL